MNRLLVACAVTVAVASCEQADRVQPEPAVEPTRIMLQCDGVGSGPEGTTQRRITLQIDLENETVAAWNPETGQFSTYTDVNEGGDETVEVNETYITIQQTWVSESEDSGVTSHTTINRQLGTIEEVQTVFFEGSRGLNRREDNFEGRCVLIDEPGERLF